MTTSELTSLEKLGRNIAARRHLLALSQDALAASAEISNRTLQKLELGKTDPRYSTLEKLANVLGVSVKELVPDDFWDAKRPKSHLAPTRK